MVEDLHEKQKDLIEAGNTNIRHHVSRELQEFQDNLALKNHYERILRSLAFADMEVRQDQIPDAHKHTCEWIFEDSDKHTAPWDSFRAWLESGQEFYWISGKAGSGKSTLMNFIENDKSTTDLEKRWSSAVHVRSSFFFWRAGTSLQKSALGFLRFTLYQILYQSGVDETVISTCFPRVGEPIPTWTVRRLESAIRHLTDQREHDVTLTILLDGLDELEGNIDGLLHFLIDLVKRSSVRCVVSSRPYKIFENAFKKFKKLRLQDFNAKDIEVFVSDHIKIGFSEHRPYAINEMSTITRLLLSRAEGVFLWARVAVNSVVEGLRNEDTLLTLHRRIENLPIELQEMFQYMVSNIPELYRMQARRLFQVVIFSYRPLTLLDIALTNFEDEGEESLGTHVLSNDMISRRCKLAKVYLETRCAGLLEVRTRRTGRASDTYTTKSKAFLAYEEDIRLWASKLHSYDGKTNQQHEYFDRYAHVDFIHATAFDFLILYAQDLVYHGPIPPDDWYVYEEVTRIQIRNFRNWHLRHNRTILPRDWNVYEELARAQIRYLRNGPVVHPETCEFPLVEPLCALRYIIVAERMDSISRDDLVDELDEAARSFANKIEVGKNGMKRKHWSSLLLPGVECCLVGFCIKFGADTDAPYCCLHEGASRALPACDVLDKIAYDTEGLCATLGLFYYIQKRLKCVNTLRKTYYLHCALAGLCSFLQWHGFADVPELKRLDLVNMILESGADPTTPAQDVIPDHDSTLVIGERWNVSENLYEADAWQTFLRSFCVFLERSEKKIRKGVSGEARTFLNDWSHRWVESFRTFIDANADTNQIIEPVYVRPATKNIVIGVDMSVLALVQYAATTAFPALGKIAQHLHNKGAVTVVRFAEPVYSSIISQRTACALVNPSRDPQYPHVPDQDDVQDLNANLERIAQGAPDGVALGADWKWIRQRFSASPECVGDLGLGDYPCQANRRERLSKMAGES